MIRIIGNDKSRAPDVVIERGHPKNDIRTLHAVRNASVIYYNSTEHFYVV
jgi:hypothetical protein